MTLDQRSALVSLLLLPDEDGLTRAHTRKYEGDPEQARKLFRFLPSFHAAYQIVARDNERLR